VACAGDPPREHADRWEKIHERVVGADSAIGNAAALCGPDTRPQLHEAIEEHLHRALESQYLVGQLLAMPSIVDQLDSSVPRLNVRPQLLPGAPGFDPWCLTAPSVRGQFRADRAAVRAIANLWRLDPDPGRTVDLHAQIVAAREQGLIRYAVQPDGELFGSYYCCPWAAIYQVVRPVRLAGQRWQPLQQFTLDVSAEEMPETGAFVRRLLPGPFHPSSEVDYCDPAADSHG